MSGPCPSRKCVNGETKRLVVKRIANTVDVFHRGVSYLSALCAWHRMGAEQWGASVLCNLWLVLWNATRCCRSRMLICKTSIAYLLPYYRCTSSKIALSICRAAVRAHRTVGQRCNGFRGCPVARRMNEQLRWLVREIASHLRGHAYAVYLDVMR